MKLKFERFDGICCFTIRGKIELSQLRILAVGLETLIKDLSEPLVVNFSLAEIDPNYLKTLIELKKILAKTTNQKIYWVGKGKGLTDFLSVSLLFSRLGGFKLRQVGERIELEDSVIVLKAKSEALKAEVEKLGGNADQAQKIILENITLKTQSKILKHTLATIGERMKEQTRSTPSDAEHSQKVKAALEELKTAFSMEIDL